MICTHNGAYTKWYQSKDHTLTYIPKQERHLAEQLAQKAYLSLLQKDLSQELKAVNFYFRHHSSYRSEQLLTDSSDLSDLLSSAYKPLSKELSDWSDAPYDSNPNYPEQLIHKTFTGQMVRSKSEALISLLLSSHKIPFRYEAALTLGKSTIFPDFTIRHPKTGQFFYWEHFGLMDQPEYCKNACHKLQLYSAYGIIPSVGLITTYETKNSPLEISMIENLVDYYFVKH